MKKIKNRFIKLFMATIEISNLEYRIKELSQKIAIDEK